jgi:hypothetical protein
MVIEAGSWAGFVVWRQMAMNDLAMLAMLLHLVDVLWRQPHETQDGGHRQPCR